MRLLPRSRFWVFLGPQRNAFMWKIVIFLAYYILWPKLTVKRECNSLLKKLDIFVKADTDVLTSVSAFKKRLTTYYFELFLFYYLFLLLFIFLLFVHGTVNGATCKLRSMNLVVRSSSSIKLFLNGHYIVIPL